MADTPFENKVNIIVRAILAVGLSAATVALVVADVAVPDYLVAFTGAALGFFLGAVPGVIGQQGK